MITGGTGSFGNAVLNRFLRTDIGEFRIFSRDEKKQDDMRHDFQARMPEVVGKIKFYIGDVRNKITLKYAMKGVDYVPRCCAEAGALVRVLPNGGCKDKRHWHGQYVGCCY